MVDIKLKYQGSLFVDISWLKPDAKTIKSLIDEFSDYDMIPTTFQEAQPNLPVKVQRLMMSSAENGIQIIFGSNRIDIIKFPTDFNGSNIGSFEDFNNLLGQLIARLYSFIGMKFTRASLVSEVLLREMTENEFEKAYSNIFKTSLNRGINDSDEQPKEWTFRNVIKSEIEVNTTKEKINRVLQINRSQGAMGINEEQIEFDRLHLIIDLNTISENKISRLDDALAISVFESFTELHQTITQLSGEVISHEL